MKNSGLEMKYDVIIVGGGPAGSTAAKILSENGIKTLLIDKDKFPRDKPCGGGISLRVLDRFDYIKNTDLLESYSYGGIAYSPSFKYKLELIDNKPIVGMVLRKKFDHGLLKIAKDCGTDVIEGKKVMDVKIQGDVVKIFLDKGTTIYSEIVIGADGVWSTIGKKTGLYKDRSGHAVCVLKEYKLDKNTVDKYYGNNRCGHLFARFKNITGYGWVFPKKEHINIGIGSIIKSYYGDKYKVNLSNLYEQFLDTLKKQKMVPKNLNSDNIKGGALPIYPLNKTYGNRVILIGDAAGVINPLTAEGIYYAMSSAEIGAKVILNALDSQDTSEAFLENYQTKWKKDFGDDIDLLIKALKVKKRPSTENFFKNASSDKKLNDLFIKILTGQISIKENKWKIARRIILTTLKSRFTRN
jgi:geranylgeranyl reductase family protein